MYLTTISTVSSPTSANPLTWTSSLAALLPSQRRQILAFAPTHPRNGRPELLVVDASNMAQFSVLFPSHSCQDWPFSGISPWMQTGGPLCPLPKSYSRSHRPEFGLFFIAHVLFLLLQRLTPLSYARSLALLHVCGLGLLDT